ncbi:hypothetical protein [Ureaplasma parvum]|uniref:hypothetical protein n=1 Tax=Ureaplasma parvum TaxID=134821 RepID=UPI001C918E74|nr:hypothetical protein [Ureaplasma parvum]
MKCKYQIIHYTIMDAMNYLDIIDPQIVKVIYIDPSYNTKFKNFEYLDDRENWNSWTKNILLKAKKFNRRWYYIYLNWWS